ncbi:transposase [Streptomyces sp. NPDC056987]|uniref:transposase n=1 Tax=Streptomyces sp. NPDC056987 TaxID=3345988 RepID=UPI00363BE3C1
MSAGDNPQRLRTEASFARLCGVAPLPASSGRTDRHRLHRGGTVQEGHHPVPQTLRRPRGLPPPTSVHLAPRSGSRGRFETVSGPFVHTANPRAHAY